MATSGISTPAATAVLPAHEADSFDHQRYEKLRNQSKFQAQGLQRANEQIQELQTKLEDLENDLRSKDYEITELMDENERAPEEIRKTSVSPFGSLRDN